MHEMSLNVGNTEKYYLLPGEIFSSKKPHIVDTILGSCIAIFLWDPLMLCASINHYMLPSGNKESSTSYKYGNVAIPEIIHRMMKMGSTKNNIQAKIFGGSEIAHSNSAFNIGRRNIVLAQDLLKMEQIPIVSFSVGGPHGRKVIFNSTTGEVLISYIKQDINVIDQKNNAHK